MAEERGISKAQVNKGQRRSRFLSFGGWLSLIFGLLFALIGLWLVVGGFRLITLGGSAYYLIAGILLFISGAFLIAERRVGVLVYALTVLGTFVWTLFETGLFFWGLLPRLFMFL